MEHFYCKAGEQAFCFPAESTKRLLNVEAYEGVYEIDLDQSGHPPIQGFSIHFASLIDPYPIPAYFKSFAEVPSDSQLILCYDGQSYTTFFCLSHQGQQVTLKGGREGLILSLKAHPGPFSKNKRSCLISMKGANLYKVINQTLAYGLKATGGFGKLPEEKKGAISWIKRLGWECRHLDHPLNDEALIAEIKALIIKGFPPDFVLINQTWRDSSRDSDSFEGFKARADLFPHGLRAFIETLAGLGIRHVGIWHSFLEFEKDVQSYSERPSLDLSEEDSGLGSDLGLTFQFFNDFYTYLREQGISFVKIGKQNQVGFLSAAVDQKYKNLQSAVQAAASIQFNTIHFNSESLNNDNLFYWPKSEYANVAEKIDQACPQGVFQAIRNSLMNALWLQNLMIPDFDAWISHPEYDEILAVFHALSGSTVVLCQSLESSQAQLLRKMMLPCGLLLQTDRPLTVCEDSVFINPLQERRIYKTFTFKADHGILGIFNLSSCKKGLHGEISPEDVEGIEGEDFAIFSHHHGFLGVIKKTEKLGVTLKPSQCDVVTIVPVENGVAVLGCYAYFITRGPLFEINLDPDSLHLSSYVAAPLLVYSERLVLEVRRNGLPVPWEYDERKKILSIDSRELIQNFVSNYCITFEA